MDRTIPTFARGELPHFAGDRGTFLNCPYVEDVHDVGDAEVAIFGAPLDAGTTYRPGTRFGPAGIRRSTNLFGTYCYELGVDLREQLNLVDIGDVFTIPGNLEKSFDQISQAMAHVVQSGVVPVVLGGDHSIGFPPSVAWPPHVDGNIGIIHFDRHVDTQETDLDERMHTTRGSTPPTSPMLRPRTWCRSASAGGRHHGPGSRLVGSEARRSSRSVT